MAKASKSELLNQPIIVAVLGSGGREHALVRKIAESQFCKTVLALPGNDGFLNEPHLGLKPKIKTVAINVFDLAEVLAALKSHEVDLVVVSPDDLLARGYVDHLTKAGFLVFGPTQQAAQIETQKSFAKKLLTQAKVATADYIECLDASLETLEKIKQKMGDYPLVFKYDGLALGKGVQICADQIEAQHFLKQIFLEKKLERSGIPSSAKVIVEHFLQGHEVSLFALCDGHSMVPLEPACDYKKLLAANHGPNTGGMGAYSPVPWLPNSTVQSLAHKIFEPVLAELKKTKIIFKGLLYAGLMVRGNQFWVLEFNARFGDPETQCLLPRLESDLLPLLYGVANETLARNLEANPLRWSEQSAVNVVLASAGYPDNSQTGKIIEVAANFEGDQLYFAGVKAIANSEKLQTQGGRVLSVTCLGEDLETARHKTLRAIEKIHFEGMQYRRDIGQVRPGA